MINKKQTLMKRRRNAIIAAAVAIVVLAVALAVVMDFARTLEIKDPVDDSSYYIRYKDKQYRLFAADKKTQMPTEVISNYSYYVMSSGTLVEIDPTTGAYDIIPVDMPTEGSEQIEYFTRYLMFPHIQRSSIKSIDVYNSKGQYTFCRYDENDNSSDFIIKGSPQVQFDAQKFSSLVVSAGYTISIAKISDPIIDERGEFSEYGLAAAVRPLYDEQTGKAVMLYDEQGDPVIDAQGKHIQATYEYTPAYYVVTDTKGNQYKVVIGDALPDGSGYYAQYVDVSGETEIARKAVYVLSTTYGSTILESIESYVTPLLTQPLSLNNYFDVEDFFIFKKDKSTNELAVSVGFSFIDIAERENTIRSAEPYVFVDRKLDGYKMNVERANLCLESLYSPTFVGVSKVAPSWEELVEYGLATRDGVNEDGEPLYVLDGESVVSFKFDHAEDGAESKPVYYVIYFSDFNENGNRYAYTQMYEITEAGKIGELMYGFDMIVEVEDYTLEFLQWDEYDWIYNNYFQLNIAFCEKIELISRDYWATFELDNSKSDMKDQISSTNISITGKDSLGNDTTTFSGISVVDNNGNIWTITSKTVKCHTPGGEELRLKIAEYQDNAIGLNVRVLTTYIEAMDGSKVYVTADEVRVEALSPEKSVTYVRYDTDLFRMFYQTLLASRIANTYELSAEEEAALLADESKLRLTLKVLDTEGTETVYCFYSLTARKSYITINGGGGFYVQADRTERFISEVQKFFANQPIQ